LTNIGLPFELVKVSSLLFFK